MTRKIFLTIVILMLTSLRIASAESNDPVWLTLLGDPLDSRIETVQVDVMSAVVFDATRLVKIRTNRSHERTAGDGGRFRSYESTVQIDCNEGTAIHRSQLLFVQPLWVGETRSIIYTDKDPEVMAFRGMEKNPRDRIIRAACSINAVKKSK